MSRLALCLTLTGVAFVLGGPTKAAPISSELGRLPDGCTAHEAGGYAVRLDRRGSPGNTPDSLPRVTRGPAAYALSEGDTLCANDFVINPAKSPWTVGLLLAGRRRETLAPGDQVLVPKPMPWTALVELKARFDQFFGASASDVPSVTRGANLQDGPASAQLRTANAVREWGPFFIAWPKQPGSAPGATVAIITDGSQTWRLPVRGEVLRIDLGRYCAKGCIIARSEDERAETAVRLHIVAQAEAPRPPWLLDASTPEGLALEGAWLLQNEPGERWSLQGESALWQSACVFPVILETLHRRYFSIDDAALCEPVRR